MLNITVSKNEVALKLEVEGRLDTTTAPQLETTVKDNITGIEHLEFDLKGLEYISSAGLRVLLSTQKIMNKQGDMVLKNVSEEVYEVFDITGFADILTIEK